MRKEEEMRNEIAKISDRIHALAGNGFEGKYIVYFHPAAGVRGEERELEKGPKLYNPEEFLKLAVPPEPKPDDRPEEIKEAQAAMETAEEEYSTADQAWWKAKDQESKLRRSSFGTNKRGETGYNNPEALETAQMRIDEEFRQLDQASEKLGAARARYHSLMKAWSHKKQVDEYVASVQMMAQQKQADQEKRRRTLFGFLKS